MCRRAARPAANGTTVVGQDRSRRISRHYRGLARIARSGASSPHPAFLIDLIKIVWNRAKGYKLLIAGSASGELVGALRARGIDAWGIENNRAIQPRRRRN